jgi:hypothetical protein
LAARTNGESTRLSLKYHAIVLRSHSRVVQHALLVAAKSRALGVVQRHAVCVVHAADPAGAFACFLAERCRTNHVGLSVEPGESPTGGLLIVAEGSGGS